MSITSYNVIESTIQRTGEQRVQVGFVDPLGLEHRRSYDFVGNVVIEEEILNRQAEVWDGLVEAEKLDVVAKIERGEDVTILNYTTWQDVKLLYTERIGQKDKEIILLDEEKTRLEEAGK